jgi:hypothetical protein
MEKIKLSGSVGYVYKVFIESLKKAKIETVSGALNEKSVLIAIPYENLANELTTEINKELWELKIKNGKMFLVGMRELVDEDVKKVNAQILSKLKKYNIDAGAYITDDGNAVVMVSLNDVVMRILENTLNETKKRAGNHMRTLRVKFGNDEKYGYVVLYTKSEKNKDDMIKKVEEMLGNE